MSEPMKLPEFICVGAPKCGSSWLHQLLESHPRVFIPGEVKEVHFFDQKFDRGLPWYSQFFASADDDALLGEITPNYLYADPQRLTHCDSIKKLILIYRDPVERCISHYKFRMRLDNYNGSFEQFLSDYPEAIDWSCYGKHFQRYLQVFDRDQFLVLRFETATQQLETTKQQLADFLGLDRTLFPEDAGVSRVNQAYKPRNRALYKTAVRIAKWMADNGLYRVRNWLKQNPLARRLLTNETEKFDIQIDDSTRTQLAETFAADQALFHSLIAGQQTQESIADKPQ